LHEVVPIDIRLGAGKCALVVSGPNTGGKTVALKTLGILTLMARAGILVPADDGSVVPWVDGVFTDLADDQSIERISNNDDRDLARKATVMASAHEPGREPARILDGFVRDIPKGDMHHWGAKLGDTPAWVELAWQQPQTIGWVQITFDSGFQRELTLTSLDRANQTIVRAPQPETVRDYELQIQPAGSSSFETVSTISGNHQRLNRISFEPRSASKVRLLVKKTNGDPIARVFEIRAYEKSPLPVPAASPEMSA